MQGHARARCSKETPTGDAMAKRRKAEPHINVEFADFDDDRVIDAVAEALLPVLDDGALDRFGRGTTKPRRPPAARKGSRKRSRP